MSDFERKKKMISLRISDAEYAVLKSQYRTHGARNVSDLARLALQRIMRASSVPKDDIASQGLPTWKSAFTRWNRKSR